MRFRNINIRNILEEAVKNQAVIVDVRDRMDFIQGHIPMAVNLPLEEIKKGIVNLPKNKYIIVYCETGGASTFAAKLLSEKGYQVINSVGGIKNYKGAMTKKNK